MSVYRDKRSPYFQFDFQIDGYRFSGSTKCRNERDAQTFEDARKVEAQELVDQLNAAGSGPLQLKAACDRWWIEHGSTLSDVSIKRALDRLVEIMGPKKFLHAITDADVTLMIQKRRADTRRDCTVIDDDGKRTILYRPITLSTVNRTIDLLRRVMRRARDNWNVAIIREPKWRKHRFREKRGHVRELTATEEMTLDAAEDADYAELRRFAIITGLRKRNLILLWPQIDFELGVIRVITKGGEPRVVPMTREVYQMLWRRRGDHPEYVFTFRAKRTRQCPKTKRQYVKGQRYPMTYAGVTSNKTRKWAKAGIKARIHDLRHTTGMRTLRRTRNLRVVQELLGHTDIKTTADFYTAAMVDDLRAAMEEATAPAAAPLFEQPSEGQAESQASGSSPGKNPGTP
jgi:integrase